MAIAYEPTNRRSRPTYKPQQRQPKPVAYRGAAGRSAGRGGGRQYEPEEEPKAPPWATKDWQQRARERNQADVPQRYNPVPPTNPRAAGPVPTMGPEYAAWMQRDNRTGAPRYGSSTMPGTYPQGMYYQGQKPPATPYGNNLELMYAYQNSPSGQAAAAGSQWNIPWGAYGNDLEMMYAYQGAQLAANQAAFARNYKPQTGGGGYSYPRYSGYGGGGGYTPQTYTPDIPKWLYGLLTWRI